MNVDDKRHMGKTFKEREKEEGREDGIIGFRDIFNSVLRLEKFNIGSS